MNSNVSQSAACGKLAMAMVMAGSVAMSLGCGSAPLTGPPAEQPGPWPVGHTAFSITDSSRGGRMLPVDAWYPIAAADAKGAHAAYTLPMPVTTRLGLPTPPAITGAAFEVSAVASQRFPMVVISHGDGGSSLDYYYLTEELATHGFFVVALATKRVVAGNAVMDMRHDCFHRLIPAMVVDVVEGLSD